MSRFILVLIVINLIGFNKYIDYSYSDVSYRTQMLIDFLCPIGSFIGRITFAFKLTENYKGLIFGTFLEIFIAIIFMSFFT